ncbi:MAG: M23 family metallopeptidase [Intrasporangium sp.]|uniref:M23 family metallopeptidase n=1 Tax=Intrasporangium sp. TaxID=1925024 RepID=UPI003F804D09
MSRRITSLLALLLVVAMLPFLSGSGATPDERVVLAAGAHGSALTPGEPGAAGDASSNAAGGGRAPGLQAAGASAAVVQELEQLAGDDLFLFPSLALAASQPVSSLSATAGLSWPLQGPVTSGFGPRIHPLLGRPMFHTGIDLGAACGTPIHAAADGQVVYAAITPSWGRRVIIRHSTSLETGYAHMSQFLVQQGDVVRRGQVIGLVGTTGWSTGCHLHFDVILDGNYVDPAPYLGLPATSTSEVPFQVAPQVEAGAPGALPTPAEDGDVPISAAVPSPAASSSSSGAIRSHQPPMPPRPTRIVRTTSKPSGPSSTTDPVPSPSASTTEPPTTSTSPPVTATGSTTPAPKPDGSPTSSTTSATGASVTSSPTDSPTDSSSCGCSTTTESEPPTTTSTTTDSTTATTTATASPTQCTASTCPTATAIATGRAAATVETTTQALLASGTATSQH